MIEKSKEKALSFKYKHNIRHHYHTSCFTFWDMALLNFGKYIENIFFRSIHSSFHSMSCLISNYAEFPEWDITEVHRYGWKKWVRNSVSLKVICFVFAYKTTPCFTKKSDHKLHRDRNTIDIVSTILWTFYLELFEFFFNQLRRTFWDRSAFWSLTQTHVHRKYCLYN